MYYGLLILPDGMSVVGTASSARGGPGINSWACTARELPQNISTEDLTKAFPHCF
jgi:hypothetical protein